MLSVTEELEGVAQAEAEVTSFIKKKLADFFKISRQNTTELAELKKVLKDVNLNFKSLRDNQREIKGKIAFYKNQVRDFQNWDIRD